MPAQPHWNIITGLKCSLVLWVQSSKQSGSIAKSFIIQPRANMCTVERNSPDKLEATFPKKEMSLFLVSHSTKIMLVWAQKGTKMQIWVPTCTSDHAPVCYLRILLRRWRGAPYTSQNILGSQISENHDPFRKSDVIKIACGPCRDCRYPRAWAGFGLWARPSTSLHH